MRFVPQSVLTKASTWSIENEDVAQGQLMLEQIEAAEALRAAVNSKRCSAPELRARNSSKRTMSGRCRPISAEHRWMFEGFRCGSEARSSSCRLSWRRTRRASTG